MAQKINRLVASRGPALVTYDSAYFYSREDIVIELTTETTPIPSSAFGDLTEVVVSRKARCSFVPIGEVEHLAVLFPYASTIPGTSIFGASDKPLLIQPLDTTQRQVTFHAAGISKMPSLRFSARDTVFADAVEFQMVRANDTEVGTANELFTFATNTLAANRYDAANLIIQAYELAWHSDPIQITLTFGAETTATIDLDGDGDAAAILAAFNALTGTDLASVTGSIADGFTLTFTGTANEGAITGAIVAGAPDGTTVEATVVTSGGSVAEVVLIEITPWGSFQSREGAEVAFDLQLEEDSFDAGGHYDTIFRGMAVRVTAQPMGVDQEALLTAARIQGSGSVPGTTLVTDAHDLDIRGTGLYFRLYNAQLDGAGLVFGASAQRIPPMTWKASRSVTSGTLDPLYYIGTSAP